MLPKILKVNEHVVETFQRLAPEYSETQSEARTTVFRVRGCGTAVPSSETQPELCAAYEPDHGIHPEERRLVYVFISCIEISLFLYRKFPQYLISCIEISLFLYRKFPQYHVFCVLREARCECYVVFSRCGCVQYTVGVNEGSPDLPVRPITCMHTIYYTGVIPPSQFLFSRS